MWKSISLSIVMLIVLLSLIDCSALSNMEEAESGMITQENTDSVKTVISWWYVPTAAEEGAFWKKMADDYMAEHPDVTIEITVPEGEPFKSRLATVMQAGMTPDIFPSWGGNEMSGYIRAGLLKDITPELDADGGVWRDTFAPGALAVYAYQGKNYGVPWAMSMVGFWYNSDLFDMAGIDAPPATWAELLDDVRKLKAAGITPIALGESDKWPGCFYWIYLALRIGGRDAFDAASSGMGSFTDSPFIEAGEKLQELNLLSPFQKAFLDMTYSEQSSLMGNGEAAMELMGEWAPELAGNASADQQGTGGALGFFPFPIVEGGAGSVGDAMGGSNGFVVGRDAPLEAVDFVKFLTSKANQTELARINQSLPVVKGSEEGLSDPMLLLVYDHISVAVYVQPYFDRYLPPVTGEAIKDAVQDLFAGTLTAEEVAQQIEDSAAIEIK